MKSVRLLAVAAIVCLAVLGMLYVTELVSADFIEANVAKVVAAFGVLVIAIAAIKVVSGGAVGQNEADAKDTEPPPTL